MSGTIAPLLVLAAVVLGDGKGVDCRVGEGFTHKYVPNRVLARPKRGVAVDRATLATAIARLFPGAVMREPTTVGSGTLVFESTEVDISKDLRFNLPGGLRDAAFMYIERDPYIFPHAAIEPNDEYFRAKVTPLWGLDDIRAPEAWAKATGSTDVVVAVLDGGIYFDHDDLDYAWSAANQVDNCPPGTSGYDAILNECKVTVNGSHGSRMAGAIGATGNNKIGVVGVNWKVGLLSVTFMESGIGCVAAAANALHFVRLVKEKNAGAVRVVNLSWGSTTDSKTIQEELRHLSDAGIVLVASAGNSGKDIDQAADAVYPAAYSLDTLITVANSGIKEKLAADSNYGTKSVHIAAPGTNIYTTYIDNKTHYARDSGTSIAAAHVSGAIALLAGRCSCLSGKELKELLLNNCPRRPMLDGKVEQSRGLRVDLAMTECASACR